MESKGKYVITGIFIVTFITALVLVIVWKNRLNDRKDFDTYYIYMKESVSGLQKDSAVKYMGVQIGKVKKIEVDPENPEEVRITIKVPRRTQIRKGMWATLKSIGITGLSYIEISGGNKNEPLLKQKEGEIPTIPSKPSMFARLGISMEDLSFQISRVSKRIGEVLSKENIQNLNDILQNLEETTDNLRKFFSKENAENVQVVLNNLKKASKKLDCTLEHIDQFAISNREIPFKVKKLIETLDKGAKAAMKTVELVRKSFARGDYNLKGISQGTLDNINRLVDNMRDITVRIHAILDTLESSPSDLLFKSSTPLPGPGEGTVKR